MATPITFDPFLGWVDITDPDNIPEDARLVGASDLLRYESFCRDAAAELSRSAGVADNAAALVAEALDDISTLGADVIKLKAPRTVATKTGNYTMAAADYLIITNAAAVTITVPAAAANTGREVIVKNRHTSSSTVVTAGGTIDGSATKSLAQWASVHLISDGTNWYVV